MRRIERETARGERPRRPRADNPQHALFRIITIARLLRSLLLGGIVMSKIDSKTLPKPPMPEYDRFGFRNNLKRSESVHWSRPWTAENEHSRSDTEKSADKAQAVKS
jgi:hypothetical protein